MNTRNEFYDQYYDHSFCVYEEKDVLQTDIKGSGLMARLQRWWFDQFLLSTQSLRCRKYYVSSFSAMRERLTHFRNYRRIIHPFSKFRTKWECFMLIVWLCKALVLHYSTSIVTPDLDFSVYVAAVIMELVTMVDLFLNTMVGYVDRDTRTIVLNRRDIIINYLSTTVCLDAFSVIPVHIIMFLRYGSNIACDNNLCKSNSFVCTMRFLDTFLTIKIIEASRFMLRKRTSYSLSASLRMFRILIIFVNVMFMLINFSDNLSLIRFMYTGVIDKSSYRFLIKAKFTYTKEDYLFYNIGSEMSRVCKTLLLFGYVMENSTIVSDKAKVLLSFVVANLFCIWCLIEGYGILHRHYFTEDKREILKDRTINLLRSRQLPDALGDKVRNYYKYSGSKAYVVQRDNTLYAALLESLKKEIRASVYGRLIKRIPFFTDWPSHVLHDIVVLIEEDIYLQGDVVSSPWSQGDGLVILEAGELSVFNIRNEETSHLIDGDYFGELSLVTDQELRMSTVVAVSNSKVLLLDKAPFRELMMKYPHLFFALKRDLQGMFRGGSEKSMKHHHDSLKNK